MPQSNFPAESVRQACIRMWSWISQAWDIPRESADEGEGAPVAIHLCGCYDFFSCPSDTPKVARLCPALRPQRGGTGQNV